MGPEWAILASSVLGPLMSSLFSNQSDVQNVPTLTDEQIAFQNQQMEQAQGLSAPGGGYNRALQMLQDYLNPESELYKNFEKPYLQQFEQQIVPGLAERFAGFGGGMGGGLSSSGFGQALGAAGGNLQANLAQLKSTMGRQSINDLINQYNQLSQNALRPQFSPVVQQPGGGAQATAGIAQMLPMLMANAFKSGAPTATNPGGGGGFPTPGYGGWHNQQVSGPYNLPTFGGF